MDRGPGSRGRGMDAGQRGRGEGLVDSGCGVRLFGRWM